MTDDSLNMTRSEEPKRLAHAKTSDKDLSVQRIILVEGSANVVALVAKLFVGIATGSLAVLGDAIHSLTDVANNIVTWFVIRVSAKPAGR
jgi:divalent metal cation (Fe/Co/Zn/Cd) transporter